MKKIFNKEFKIGVFVILAILILIFGIDYLKGINLFNITLKENNIWCKTLPIEAAIENNGCLRSPTAINPERELFFKALRNDSFKNVVNRFLKSRKQWIFDIYYGLPSALRNVVRKVMDKRMKYE